MTPPLRDLVSSQHPLGRRLLWLFSISYFQGGATLSPASIFACCFNHSPTGRWATVCVENLFLQKIWGRMGKWWCTNWRHCRSIPASNSSLGSRKRALRYYQHRKILKTLTLRLKVASSPSVHPLTAFECVAVLPQSVMFFLLLPGRARLCVYNVLN